MYLLDKWVSSIETEPYFIIDIDDVTESKKVYSDIVLRHKVRNYLEEKYPNFYKIYTDGSKSELGIGAAFYDIRTKEYIKFNISNNVSIMYAELIAIAEATAYIECIDYQNFVILSDSKSAIQHLIKCSTPFRGIPLAYDIIQNRYRLEIKGKNVIIQWIPAHIGLDGNEEVDRLAKEAAVDGLTYNCLPHFSSLIGMVKRKCLDLWTEYFDERSVQKGIWYKTIQPSLPHTFWWDGTNMSRNDILIALRLRSGHIPLNKFKFMMKKSDSPNCTECQLVEDVYHIIMECARNEACRQYAMLYELSSVTPSNVGWCNSILAAPYSLKAKVLYRIVRAGIVTRNS